MSRFEELEVWKRAARLSANLYIELAELKDFGFWDQITRAGLSIPSNIAEGYERNSEKELANFLNYAKGSAGELRTQIYIGIEIGTSCVTLASNGFMKPKKSPKCSTASFALSVLA